MTASGEKGRPSALSGHDHISINSEGAVNRPLDRTRVSGTFLECGLKGTQYRPMYASPLPEVGTNGQEEKSESATQ